MNRLIANTLIYALMVLLSIPPLARSLPQSPLSTWHDSNSKFDQSRDRIGRRRQSGHEQWIGTWAAAPQPPIPGRLQTFRNQTLRLIVHTSVGGTKVRIKISNTFGDHPLLIGGAHIARRTAAAEIDSASDRTLMFHGHSSTTIRCTIDGGERSGRVGRACAIGFGGQPLSSRDHSGDNLAHSGKPDQLRLPRHRGLHRDREISSRQNHSFLAIPHGGRCRSFVPRSSHRCIWLLPHGRRRFHIGYQSALA